MTFTYKFSKDGSLLSFDVGYRLRNTSELQNHILANQDLFQPTSSGIPTLGKDFTFSPDHRLAQYTDILRKHLPNISKELRVCYFNYMLGFKHYDHIPETLGGYYNISRSSSNYYDPHVAYRLDLLLKTYDTTTTVSDLLTSNILAPEDYIPVGAYRISRVDSKTYKTLDTLLDVPILFVHAYAERFGFLPNAEVGLGEYQESLAWYLSQGS